MKDLIRIKNYYKNFTSLLKQNEKLFLKQIEFKKILSNINKNDKKVFIFGNGGSALLHHILL